MAFSLNEHDFVLGYVDDPKVDLLMLTITRTRSSVSASVQDLQLWLALCVCMQTEMCACNTHICTYIQI